MAGSTLHVDPLDDLFAQGFAAIRAELDIDELPAEVLKEGEESARRGPAIAADADCRDVPFVTIDPPGSRDLDQALHIAGQADGWLVQYAIADVAAFVPAGSAIDAEARRRGVTLYLPDQKSPLHPPSLSEGAASLLPDEDRQALVWRVRLDSAGDILDVDVQRALVRSRSAFSYEQVQAALDAGEATEIFKLLRAAGSAREAVQAARGGLDLRLPDQTVISAAGTYELVYRAPVPVEGWNAQMSLLVGECAARLMLDAGNGVLRTLPSPSVDAVERFRRHAQALGVPWPDGVGHAEFIRSLDARAPDHAALIVQSAKLARGAGYQAFRSAPGDDVSHAAVGAPYAHVTAPLRRLVDRFASELALAACRGTTPPAWALEALDSLPELMDQARERERAAERMAISLAEAAVLSGCLGALVDGVVVSAGDDRATVQLRRPAVVADIASDGLSLGDEVRLRVTAADALARTVVLEPA